MSADESQIVYGPVPSWRFGISLGIDATKLPKKCTISCIYCQLGVTKDFELAPSTLPQYTTPEELEDALIQKLNELDVNTIDVVMFSGSGEPTLNVRLSELIDIVRKYIPEKPVGILTNGTLLKHEAVREALHKLDMVSLKLDAATQELFQQINHPPEGIPSIDELIEEYGKFREEYEGWLGLEIMLLTTTQKGITNLAKKERQALLEAIQSIKPDVVELEVPYRPPAWSDVSIPSSELIEEFEKELVDQLGEARVWLYGKHDASRGHKPVWKRQVTAERVLNILKHRPCRITDLMITMGVSTEKELETLLQQLLDQKQIIAYTTAEGEFYTITGAKRIKRRKRD